MKLIFYSSNLQNTFGLCNECVLCIYMIWFCFFFSSGVFLNTDVDVNDLYGVEWDGFHVCFTFALFHLCDLLLCVCDKFSLRFIENRQSFVVELHSTAGKREPVSICVIVIFPIQSGYTCRNKLGRSFCSDVSVHTARTCRFKTKKSKVKQLFKFACEEEKNLVEFYLT